MILRYLRAASLDFTFNGYISVLSASKRLWREENLNKIQFKRLWRNSPRGKMSMHNETANCF